MCDFKDDRPGRKKFISVLGPKLMPNNNINNKNKLGKDSTSYLNTIYLQNRLFSTLS